MKIAQRYDKTFFSPLNTEEKTELTRLLRKLRLVYQGETLGMKAAPGTPGQEILRKLRGWLQSRRA
jgi:hypothetical protein